MKRHKALIPLSHDHHHGLLLAQLIKINAPDYKGLPKDLGGKINYTLEIYKSSLQKHFDDEEKILFPLVVGKDGKLDYLINEITNEHRLLENLIASLPKSNNQINMLDEIGRLLENHIRKEERLLFPEIQKILSEKELSVLEKNLSSSARNNKNCITDTQKNNSSHGLKRNQDNT